jgi:hypothetical protein
MKRKAPTTAIVAIDVLIAGVGDFLIQVLANQVTIPFRVALLLLLPVAVAGVTVALVQKRLQEHPALPSPEPFSASSLPVVTSVPVRSLQLDRFPLGANPSTEAYYPRPVFEQTNHILRDIGLARPGTYSGLIIFGVPKVGKTRFALELLRSNVALLGNSELVIWRGYYSRRPPTEFDRFAEKPLVLLIDDLQEFAPPEQARSIYDALTRLQEIRALVFVLVTSREGRDGLVSPTGKQFAWLIDQLTQVNLDRMDTVEETKFVVFLQDKGVRTPGVRDGLPGTILLGLDEVKRLIKRSPDSSKAILHSMALVRGVGVYVYPEELVRRVAQRVFRLSASTNSWVRAYRRLTRDGLLLSRSLGTTGQTVLVLPHDSYLEEGLTGIYPQPGRLVREQFADLLIALSDHPRVSFSDALFRLSEVLQGDTADTAGQQRELALKAAQAGLEPLEDLIRAGNLPDERWAHGMFVLGFAHATRSQGDPIDNYTYAYEAFGAALSIRTQAAAPIKWAATIGNRGIMRATLAKLAQDSQHADLRGKCSAWRRDALGDLSAALTVYNPRDFPDEYNSFTDMVSFLENMNCNGLSSS